MASSVVKQLTDKLEKLRAQHTALGEKIRAYEVTLADFARDGETEEQPRHTGGALTNEIWKVLQAAGEPLHYKEVLARVQAQGIYVPGGNPANNVGAHMSADPRFENVGRGTWALCSWRTQKPNGQPTPVTYGASDSSDQADETESEETERPSTVLTLERRAS